MKKLLCDFCGKEIDIKGNAMKGTKIILITNEGYVNAKTDHFDVCPNCFNFVTRNIYQHPTLQQ